MKLLKRYGPGLLACLLLAAAGALLWRGYLPARQAYRAEKNALAAENLALETRLTEDEALAPVRSRLTEAETALAAGRQALYDRFPAAMREEDQIRYMLHLEELLGQKVLFRFAEAEPLLTLSDGATLRGVTFTFAHRADYDGFKKLLRAVSGDERIASVRAASFGTGGEEGASNLMQVTLYLLDNGRPAANGKPAANGSPAANAQPANETEAAHETN